MAWDSEKWTAVKLLCFVCSPQWTYFVMVSDRSSGSIYGKYVLTFYSAILSGIYSDILSDMGTAGPQPRAPDISGHRGWDPAVLSEIWSSLLGGWGRRKKDEGRRKKDEEVTLIKSRDLYLAGGEQLKIWKTETVWICAISSKKHMKIQCFTRKQQLGLPDPTRSISSSWPTFAQAFCQAWRRGEFSSWFNPIDSLLYPQKITKHSHIYRLYIYRICIYILYRIIYSEYNIYAYIEYNIYNYIEYDIYIYNIYIYKIYREYI